MSKTFATDITGYTSTSCRICGHESHCGGPLWKEVKDYACEQPASPRSIEICKHCSCSNCSPVELSNKK
jgi:hypothetical protein